LGSGDACDKSDGNMFLSKSKPEDAGGKKRENIIKLALRGKDVIESSAMRGHARVSHNEGRRSGAIEGEGKEYLIRCGRGSFRRRSRRKKVKALRLNEKRKGISESLMRRKNWGTGRG